MATSSCLHPVSSPCLFTLPSPCLRPFSPPRYSEHPSGGGAFAFRTPSGIAPKAGALPNAPYKTIEDMQFFVWRPARWANWMFEVGSYDKDSLYIQCSEIFTLRIEKLHTET